MSRLCAAIATIGLAFGFLQTGHGADLKKSASATSANLQNDPAPGAPSGEDWPAFLGPLGTGVTRDTGIADRWPESGPPVVWSKRLDEGYAAPSVLSGKLVVFYGSQSQETVECLRADSGAPLWKFEYSEGQTTANYGDGPRATPLLAGDRCYTFGLAGRLVCLDLATGKQVWTHDTSTDFKTVCPPFGLGPTPILEGDLLIVLAGGQPNSGVVAYRAATGELVWQGVGKETWDGVETGRRSRPLYHWLGTEEMISYSSPLAATLQGKRQLLCLMRQGLVSLDPGNGRLNFKAWFSPNSATSVTAARPVVVGDDRIFLTASYRTGCTLLQVDRSSQSAKKVWDSRALQAHWSTPIYIDGYLYGFSGREEADGELVCLDVKTGKSVWTTRGYDPNRHDLVLEAATGNVKVRATGKIVPFPYFGRGSLTLAGKRLIILGERGTLALAEPSPKGYHEICRAAVPGVKSPIWPSPVLAGKKLYIRDTKRLVCLNLAGLGPAPRGR